MTIDDDDVYFSTMQTNIWAKIDAYLFRALGLTLGYAGCAALLINNSPSKVFSSPYGIVFFLIFALLGIYSTISVIKAVAIGEK